MHTLIEGQLYKTMITCHYNGKFSYFLNGRWETGNTVPRAVLDDPELPAEERARVVRRLMMKGIFP